jgi:hypothetical protein
MERGLVGGNCVEYGFLDTGSITIAAFLLEAELT